MKRWLLLMLHHLVAWLLHLVLNNRRIPELGRWMLLLLLLVALLLLLLLLALLLYGMVVSVSHARIVQVMYGWVHMAKLT